MEPLPLSIITMALALVAGTVAIHSLGSFLLIRGFVRYRGRIPGTFRYSRLIMGLTFVVMCLLVIHLFEVSLWAALYTHERCFADPRTSFYFSLVTYATVGYGDVLLTEQYRMLGGIEALVGVMMMSWSTALLMGYVHWVYSQVLDRWNGTAGTKT